MVDETTTEQLVEPQAAAIEELRSEVSYVQRLLSDLQSRLNAVCSEWSQQAETIRRLQIELEQVTRERDSYLETTKAETEAIVEFWSRYDG